MGRLNIKSWLGQLPKHLSSHDTNHARAQPRCVANLSTDLQRRDETHGAGVTNFYIVSGRPTRATPTPTNMPVSTMSQLAETISTETKKLETYFQSNSYQPPGLDAESPLDFSRLPDHVNKSRLEIIEATKKLRDLSVSPEERMRWAVWDVSVSSCNAEPDHG